MIISQSEHLKKIRLFIPSKFEDTRGTYVETWNKKYYDPYIDGFEEFVQDDISISHKMVLRGLHGDEGTWKLVQCLYGEVQAVAICCNPEDEDYGKAEEWILSAQNRLQILIPPKYAIGHLCLNDRCVWSYKQTSYYGDYPQFTVKWNDKKLDDVHWKLLESKNPILSERDSKGPFYKFKRV